MNYLAVYDITDTKRLRRIAKHMQKYGIRVQKSVFECNLTEKAINDMKAGACALMDLDADSLRIYPLLSGSREKQWIVGVGITVEFPAAYIL